MPTATPQGTPRDPLIGATLGGHYRITSLLGRGGMSRVYEAVQAPLGRAVALKVLKDDPNDPSLQKRFLLEASATSQLTHPNTITIFDYGADRGLLYFAMELLRGCTVAQALRRDGRFSEARTLHIARQVCRSLREAHVRGMIHRDLKPSNFFLTEHGDESDFVKVLDFGLVKTFGAEDSSPHLTSGGLVLGTPHYMAPEQARGLDCDQRSDVYALGVVLFQMLSGRVPYDGASTVDVLLRHVSDPVPRLSEAHPDVPVSAGLEAVVMRCMAKNPADRFQSMEDLLSALPGDRPQRTRPPPLPLADTDEMEAQPSLRSTTGKLGKKGDTHEIPGARAQGQVSSPRQQPVLPPPPPRSGMRLVLVGAAVAVVLGGSAAFLLRQKPRPVEPVAAAPEPVVAAATPVAPVVVVARPPRTEPPAAEPAPVAPSAPAVAAPEPVAPAVETHKVPAKRERAVVASKRPKPMHETTAPEVVEALKERLGRAVPGIHQCAMLDSHGRGASGELTLAVSVEPSGRIGSIALHGMELGKALESCIRGAVQRVDFEPFEGAPVRLERSITLAPH